MKNTLIELISNSDIHISDFYRIFFEKFGLEFRGECTVKELIRRVTETKVDIVSVRGYNFPTDVDFLIDEQSSTEFRKKFFGSVMFEDEDSRKNYESIMEVIDKVYVLDELEVKSPASSNTTGYAFVYIRGIEKDDKPIFGTRTEVMVIKIPY